MKKNRRIWKKACASWIDKFCGKYSPDALPLGCLLQVLFRLEALRSHVQYEHMFLETRLNEAEKAIKIYVQKLKPASKPLLLQKPG